MPAVQPLDRPPEWGKEDTSRLGCSLSPEKWPLIPAPCRKALQLASQGLYLSDGTGRVPGLRLVPGDAPWGSAAFQALPGVCTPAWPALPKSVVSPGVCCARDGSPWATVGF